jgi:hypothetical protein
VITKKPTYKTPGEKTYTAVFKEPFKTQIKKEAYKIDRAGNPLVVKGKTAKVKYRKLKKKNQKLAVSKIITFTKKGQGTMSYKFVSAKKRSKSFKKKFKINAKTGKLTIKKNGGNYTVSYSGVSFYGDDSDKPTVEGASFSYTGSIVKINNGNNK